MGWVGWVGREERGESEKEKHRRTIQNTKQPRIFYPLWKTVNLFVNQNKHKPNTSESQTHHNTKPSVHLGLSHQSKWTPICLPLCPQVPGYRSFPWNLFHGHHISVTVDLTGYSTKGQSPPPATYTVTSTLGFNSSGSLTLNERKR